MRSCFTSSPNCRAVKCAVKRQLDRIVKLHNNRTQEVVQTDEYQRHETLAPHYNDATGRNAINIAAMSRCRSGGDSCLRRTHRAKTQTGILIEARPFDAKNTVRTVGLHNVIEIW